MTDLMYAETLYLRSREAENAGIGLYQARLLAAIRECRGRTVVFTAQGASGDSVPAVAREVILLAVRSGRRRIHTVEIGPGGVRCVGRPRGGRSDSPLLASRYDAAWSPASEMTLDVLNEMYRNNAIDYRSLRLSMLRLASWQMYADLFDSRPELPSVLLFRPQPGELYHPRTADGSPGPATESYDRWYPAQRHNDSSQTLQPKYDLLRARPYMSMAVDMMPAWTSTAVRVIVHRDGTVERGMDDLPLTF